MRPEDLKAVIAIDAQVFGQRRPEYHERKMVVALDGTHQLVTSLVTEIEGKKVVGFIMGEVYLGEFGVSETTALIDTIGVDPAYEGKGVGTGLFDAYASHLRRIGVQSITTRVGWNGWDLLRFFEKVGFAPAPVVSLEMSLD